MVVGGHHLHMRKTREMSLSKTEHKKKLYNEIKTFPSRQQQVHRSRPLKSIKLRLVAHQSLTRWLTESTACLCIYIYIYIWRAHNNQRKRWRNKLKRKKNHQLSITIQAASIIHTHSQVHSHSPVFRRQSMTPLGSSKGPAKKGTLDQGKLEHIIMIETNNILSLVWKIHTFQLKVHTFQCRFFFRLHESRDDFFFFQSVCTFRHHSLRGGFHFRLKMTIRAKEAGRWMEAPHDRSLDRSHGTLRCCVLQNLC